MNNQQLIILGIFDVAGYLLITLALLRNEKVTKKEIFSFFIFTNIAMALITIMFAREYAIFLNFLNFYISTILFLKRNYKDSIIIFSISMGILFSTQLPAIILLNYLDADIQSNFLAGFVSQCVFVIVFYFFYKKLRLDILMDYINKNNRTFVIIVVNMMLIGLCTVIFYSLDVERFIELVLFFLLVSFLILTVNVLFITQALKIKYQAEIQTKQLEYQDTIYSLVEEIKQVQHEYDNHIQGLKLAITINEQDQKKDIIGYIDDIEKKQWFRNMLKTLDPVLMGVLISKYRKAQEKNIVFEIRNHNYEMRIPVKDYELTEMIGILSNNAIENTLEGGRIIMEFHKEGFLIKNNHEYLSGEAIKKIFVKGYSSKKIPSGLGLYNLKKIVDKYHGQIEVYNEKENEVNSIVFRISI